MRSKEIIVRARIDNQISDEVVKVMSHEKKTQSQVMRDALNHYFENRKLEKRINAIQAEDQALLNQRFAEMEKNIKDMDNNISDSLSEMFNYFTDHMPRK
jgi:2',3'-cyclic-nucleotide 2'-phosphodiesterase (5'-nucleotidase family)